MKKIAGQTNMATAIAGKHAKGKKKTRGKQANKQTNKQTSERKQASGKVTGNTYAFSMLVVGLLTDKGLDSKEGHEADGVGGLGKSKALVEVEATDHADGGDIVVTQETENKLSSMSSNYRRTKQHKAQCTRTIKRKNWKIPMWRERVRECESVRKA